MKVAAVQILILLVGLIIIEAILELFAPLPVPGGVYLDRNGHPARVALDELSLKPNLDLTHKGAEFTASIHTNSFGNRVIDNESRRPDFIWLGNSFTFGHGVSDKETFPYIVCTKNGFVCQNFGHSGADTFQEVNILVRAISKENFHPKNVVVVMLTACWIEESGNDLGDNLIYYRDHLNVTDAKAAGAQPHPDDNRRGIVRRLQGALGNYEIVKRAMLVFSSYIKRGAYRCSDAEQIRRALDATKIALDKLESLARKEGFAVTLVEIHPYQELDGEFRETEKLVGRIVPKSFGYIPTGKYFSKDDYYRYDGHLNATGQARLAAVIAHELKQP